MLLDNNARTVLEKRYVARDGNGIPCETVEGLFRRVADAVAAADKKFDKDADISALSDDFYKLMTELLFLPNSPTLMNAGKELGQLSACFVLPVGDSMEEIFEAVKQAALIHKSGGGTGFSFSRLRSTGSTVKTTGGVASGPVSFMRVFNMATEAVKQGGTRRGANMGILRCDHPDIMSFISAKSDNADITNFNISVGITDEFMSALESGSDYALIDPSRKTEVGRISAKEVFAAIVDGAHANGEPGIIFLDRLNRDNPAPSMGEIESTNPCGEQPLLPYESCNLGSINLSRFVTGAAKPSIDYKKLEEVIAKAVHFLDNVIEINKYPLDIIAETTLSTRKIGLGVMGFADMLLMMGIPYNSDEGVAVAEKVMEFISEKGRGASRKLAEVRGAFPKFHESIYKDGAPLRNATITTIAPTGTLSILAACSSGVEPVFAFAFARNVMDGTRLVEVNSVLKNTLEKRGLLSDSLLEQVLEHGTLDGINEIPADIRRAFVCAHDITPEAHVKMQAAFQKYCDNAVSKTVNFPHDAAKEDVEQTYRLAYSLGCKGITIYRDGSRQGQVLTRGTTEKKAEEPAQPTRGYELPMPRPRPESMMGLTKRVSIGCGNLYVTVNYDERGVCEVFTSTGKAGGCPSQSEATSRLTSIALRGGIPVEEVIRQMRGIRCPSTIRQPGMKCTSCPDAIARVISEVNDRLNSGQFAMPEVFVPASGAKTNPKAGDLCPECSSVLEHEGGCVACRNCGYAKCG